jgi:hypothetical protein
MKTIFFLAVLALAAQTTKSTHVPCVGAMKAMAVMAQEQRTPPGEWCQRPAPDMSKKAHACACHQHSCSDPDPDHVSAHVDANCKNYCYVDGCRCERDDCP